MFPQLSTKQSSIILTAISIVIKSKPEVDIKINTTLE